MGKHKSSMKPRKRDSYTSSEEEWVEKKVKKNSLEKETSLKKNEWKRSYRSSTSSNNESPEVEREHVSRKKHSDQKNKLEMNSCKSFETGSCSSLSSYNNEPNKREKRSSTPSKQKESVSFETGQGPKEHCHSNLVPPRFMSNEESKSRKHKLNINEGQQENSTHTRDEWMNLPTYFTSSSNNDCREKREHKKRLEREKQQYNPREYKKELNPHWKNGGNGLPLFKKPEESDTDCKVYESRKSNCTPNWKRKKDHEQDFPKSPEKLRSEDHSTINVTVEETNISEKDLNTLAAKLVKAEIMGNVKLVAELKEKLDKARCLLKEPSVESSEEVILTHTDSQGRTQPLRLQTPEKTVKKHKKRVETHEGRQRVRYFPDDDKYSLKQMFEHEKYNSVEDQNREFLTMTSKVGKNDDLDDIFSDNIRKEEPSAKVDSRNCNRAIQNHQILSKSLDNCDKCIQSEMMMKHLMVSMGNTAYIALTSHVPLSKGHCLIIPIRHVPCSTQLDENEWYDIVDLKKSITNLFEEHNETVIFFETALKFHKFPHMCIECVPLPKEDGDMAPIYFKKAIDESEYEWSHNKKLISLKGRDVRKAVPKGLPYFTVSFGMGEGFAHVIEEEKYFPTNFAQEIIGGMLDLDHSSWRKPKKQSFEEQSQRVLDFSKEWKKYDCTTI
ncbi:CWF19-like protein 2-like protein [Gonioctena quinquepunctata]|nr:CWF19-like protein 2-like protein [Gonioctena quinquepunctata]